MKCLFTYVYPGWFCHTWLFYRTSVHGIRFSTLKPLLSRFPYLLGNITSVQRFYCLLFQLCEHAMDNCHWLLLLELTTLWLYSYQNSFALDPQTYVLSVEVGSSLETNEMVRWVKMFATQA